MIAPAKNLPSDFNGRISGNHAILVDGKVVLATLQEWGVWLQEHDDERIVAQSYVAPGVLISTVFLGLDHGFGAKKLWLESMAFRVGMNDMRCVRYTTLDEAEKGHRLLIDEVTGRWPHKLARWEFLWRKVYKTKTWWSARFGAIKRQKRALKKWIKTAKRGLTRAD